MNEESAAAVGRHIMQESFAIIEQELGPHSMPPWAFAVLQRMIHASADFEFAHSLRYSPGFDKVVEEAFRAGVPVITDTEMVLLGIQSALATWTDRLCTCYLNDPETRPLAAASGLTRSAAGIRLAAKRHDKALLAIGNAPTALEEVLRLAELEGWRPAGVIGIPVGFVGVDEAKQRLINQTQVPYLTAVGRKGGSAVTAAAVNALVEWNRPGSP